MDHRFVKITGLVVGVPMAVMAVFSLIAIFLIDLPPEDFVYGLVRVGVWLLLSAFIGASIWLFLGNTLRSGGAPVQIPAVIGTVVMTALPASWFVLMPSSLFEYLGGATLLYWLFLMCSPCILCISAPMAWRLYDPRREGGAA